MLRFAVVRGLNSVGLTKNIDSALTPLADTRHSYTVVAQSNLCTFVPTQIRSTETGFFF